MKDTLDIRLCIGHEHINLQGYSNVHCVGEGALLWNRIPQKMVAQSTMEAKYMAMSQSTKYATTHDTAKNIDVQDHFVREKIENQIIDLVLQRKLW